ncbi:hypothetical protein ABIA33_000706 [Streptacidiphilus sp. MAP12-16]|uniref:hypothetical protein n=1 Tax=Streptacidiphilus sp. MAP12-16 TaxID=3156300 RepID=UPI003514E458
MRLKTLLGLAACVASATAALAVGPAQAAQLPCNLGGSGNTASVTCYSGAPYTWRLVVDCVDTSNVYWPRIVSTTYGAYRTGDGTEVLSCAASLRADGRIEAR